MNNKIDDTPAEPSFRYRRIYTFAGGVACCLLIGFAIYKIDGDPALKTIALALIAANIIREGFYMGGASLSDWAMLTKAWRKTEKTSTTAKHVLSDTEASVEAVVETTSTTSTPT